MQSLSPNAEIRPDRPEFPGSWVVWTSWTGAQVDRNEPSGISVGKNRKLAERLQRAINDGVIFAEPSIKTDVNGKTYVSSHCTILCRIMNAELNRLGY